MFHLIDTQLDVLDSVSGVFIQELIFLLKQDNMFSIMFKTFPKYFV